VLIPLIEEIFLQRSAAQWIEPLDAAGVPCGPINDIAQVFENPQVRHRGMKVDLAHPLAGSVALVASPMKLSATPVRYENAPPLLGEHTGDVLRELLGMDEAEISRLTQTGVI
jgi:glutaryl-CoA transferase